MKKAEAEIKQKYTPFFAECDTAEVKDTINNMINIILFRNHCGNSDNPILIEDQDGPIAMDVNGDAEPEQPSPPKKKQRLTTSVAVNGSRSRELSWKDRAVGVFIYLHPSICGLGSISERISKASRDLGVEHNGQFI